jgi:hypothetical protein
MLLKSAVHHMFHPTSHGIFSFPAVLVRLRLRDVQTKTSRIEVHLVLAALQNLGNVLCILELPQLNVGPGLLDGVTDQLCGTGLTLGADDGGLLLLAGFVDDESSALGFLLGDLLGFDCGGEFRGEGEVLGDVSTTDIPQVVWVHTVNDTSSNMMLNLAALLTKLSLTSLLTFSRCVINCEALNWATTLFSTSLTIEGSTRSS